MSRKVSIGSIGRNNIADRRHRITVEEPSETRDASSNETVRTWTTLKSEVPASFTDVRGGEYIRGRQIAANIDAVFVVNYAGDYRTDQRVLFNDVYYEIKHIRTPDGIERFIELECKATGVI